MTDLYLDRLPELDREFRKTAAFASRLSEQPENWPQEVSSELLKQLPYLSDYDLNVNLERVEPQRGYAFGYADISNKTERPEVEHTEAGLPHLRIPIIVMERAVKPFSVFLDGERVLPLNENRIRELLFQPATFDLSTAQPRDPSLVEPLMPPQRSGIGMGGEYKMASAMTKEALSEALVTRAAAKRGVSKDFLRALAWTKRGGSEFGMKQIPHVQAAKLLEHVPETKKHVDPYLRSWSRNKTSSILREIAPTISEKDSDRFVEKVASDPTIRAGLQRSGITPLLVEVFDHTKRASADDRLAALADRIEPTVITLQKLPGGDFLVKSANVNALTEGGMQGQVVPGDEAAQAMGAENTQAMQPGQTATVTAEPSMPIPEAISKAKVVDDWGQYKVQDMMGNSLLGHVFPSVLSWGDFQPMPMALFTNGSAYAIQDTIAGELVGKGVSFPVDTPRGDGCFYDIQNMDVIVSAPVTIGSSATGPDGQPRYMATDAFGSQFTIVQVSGLITPHQISDAEFAIPATWKFMRLNNQTQLIPDPVQMNKAASVQASKNEATLFFNGSYNLEGGCGLNKISSDLRYDVDAVHAEFMLGLLGLDGVTAKQKVAEARKKGSVKLAGLKSITLLSERYARAEKTASALASKIPNLRRDLLKEAAAMEGVDEGTIDHILALNFINPENLATFVSYIPELEQCSERLAEMLLMSYVGQTELPEGALERSMKNMEEVIDGLKAVASMGA